jgi:hypothetical protein
MILMTEYAPETIRMKKRGITFIIALLILFLYFPAACADTQLVNVKAIFSVGNSPPVIEPVIPIIVYETELINFIIISSDPDGDTLTYTVGPLPEEAQFYSENYTFAWKSTFFQAGIYYIDFYVSDGRPNGMASQTVTITILDPPPTFIPNPQIIAGGGTQRVLIGQVLDPDSDFTSCEVPPEHQDICSLCEIDANGEIYLTCISPPPSAIGTIETIDVSIINFPLVSIPLHIVSPTLILNIEGQKTGAEVTLLTIPFTVTGSSGQGLTFILDLQPSDLYPSAVGAFIDGQTMEIRWKPTYFQAGDYIVRLTVIDNGTGSSVSQDVTITVLDPLPTFISNPQFIANGLPQRVKIGEIPDPDTYFTSCEVPPEYQDICSLCEVDPNLEIYLTCTPPASGQGTTEQILITITDIQHGITLPPITIPLIINSPSVPSPPVQPNVRPIEPGVYIPGPPAFMLPSGKLIPRTTIQDLGHGNYLLIVYDDQGNIIGQYIITGEVSKLLKKYGKVSVYFRFEKGNCQNLTRIKTEILEEFDASIEQQIRRVVDDAGYEVREMAFIVDITIEPPCRTGNSSMFLTMNASWVYEQAGWDLSRCAAIPPDTVVPNIGIAHITDNPDGSTTSDYLSIVVNETACPDADNNIKLRVDASHLSIYGMVSVKAKETAGVSTPPNPEVAPMLVPGGMGLEAYLTENPTLIGGVVALLVIIVVLEGKFHILRRKEHKPLEHPEGGPPAWEGLIETDRQKALSAIIEVLNEVDVQLKDLDKTMVMRAPGFVFATAEADAIVEKFFYTCQVAEEKIKSAAAEEHLSPKQIDHLNGQLKDAVDRMIAVSQKSPVLAQAVQVRMSTGTAAAGGET